MAFSILTQILRDAEAILRVEGADAATEVRILAALSDLTAKVDQILAWATDGQNPPARAFSYFHPPIHRNGVPVMNFTLKNDEVVGPVEIRFVDDQGTVVPAPANASFTPTVDDPTLLNVVMNDGTHFTVNALMRAGAPTIMWHEANGLVPDYTDNGNIVEDFTPVAADSNFADAPHNPQPLPAA